MCPVITVLYHRETLKQLRIKHRSPCREECLLWGAWELLEDIATEFFSFLEVSFFLLWCECCLVDRLKVCEFFWEDELLSLF